MNEKAIEAARLAIAERRKCFLPCACKHTSAFDNCQALAEAALAASSAMSEERAVATTAMELRSIIETVHNQEGSRQTGCLSLHSERLLVAEIERLKAALAAAQRGPSPELLELKRLLELHMPVAAQRVAVEDANEQFNAEQRHAKQLLADVEAGVFPFGELMFNEQLLIAKALAALALSPGKLSNQT